MSLKKYKSHKIVEAAKIESISEDRTRVIYEGQVRGTPGLVSSNGSIPTNIGPGDYVVRYADGYVSFSPAAAFEEGYTLAEDSAPAESWSAGNCKDNTL